MIDRVRTQPLAMEPLPISMRRLVTVAGLASILRRSENVTTREGLMLIGGFVRSGAMPARLFTATGTDPAPLSNSEGATVWRRLELGAKRRRNHSNPIPPAASSWLVHVEDLEALARSGKCSGQTARALELLIAERRAPPVDLNDTISAAGSTRVRGSSPVASVSRVHRLPKARSDLLWPLIEQAQDIAQGRGRDPLDTQSVWSELERMALSAERPPPLTGNVNAIGIYYLDRGNQVFTKDALRERLRRAKAEVTSTDSA